MTSMTMQIDMTLMTGKERSRTPSFVSFYTEPLVLAHGKSNFASLPENILEMPVCRPADYIGYVSPAGPLSS